VGAPRAVEDVFDVSSTTQQRFRGRKRRPASTCHVSTTSNFSAQFPRGSVTSVYPAGRRRPLQPILEQTQHRQYIHYITSRQSNLTKKGRIVAAARGRFERIRFARWRQCAPPPNACFLGLTTVQIPLGISIGSAVFAQLTAEGPYTLQSAAPSPLKIVPSHGGICTPSNNSFLGPPEPTTQTASLLVQRSLKLTIVTDRPTDRPHTPSITIGRIYVRPNNSSIPVIPTGSFFCTGV